MSLHFTKFINMTNQISNTVTLPGVTVVGKIKLAKKNNFKHFNGGATIGEMMKAKGITIK